MGEAKRRMMMSGKVMPVMVPPMRQVDPFDISEAVRRQCIKCGGEYFDKAFRLGLISPVASRNLTGQEVRVQYETYLCRGCDHEFGAPLPVVM